MEEMNSQAGQRPKADLVKRSQTAIYENRFVSGELRSFEKNENSECDLVFSATKADRVLICYILIPDNSRQS